MKKLLLITLMLALGLTGFTQDKQFISVGGSDDWNIDGNWTPDGVPTSNDDVIIYHWVDAAPPVIYSGTNAVAKSIRLEGTTNPGPWSLTVQGNLTVSEDITIIDDADFNVLAGATVTYSGDVYVNDNSTLHVNGTMGYAPLSSIIVTSNVDLGPNTLRQAIADIGDGGVITFQLDTWAKQITLLSPLTIDKSLTIDGDNSLGSGDTVEVWQDGGSHRIFHITTAAGGKTIEFKNMEINLGYGTAPGGGGILCEAGTLNVDNVTFYGNEAGGTDAHGGAIYANNSTCNITNSTFNANDSHHNGGGMFVQAITCNITNSTFDANDCVNNGGGMYTKADTCNITNSTFDSNISGNDGGGMFVYNATYCYITNSTFDSNISGNDGGGMHAEVAQLVTITGCTVNDNEAANYGGGYSGNRSDVRITNSTFAGNDAVAAYGGAIYAKFESVDMKFTTVSGNSAATEGGGLYLNDLSILTIQNCMLGDNSAPDGGGLDIFTDPTTFVYDHGYNIVEDYEGHDFSANTDNITGQQANLFGTGLTTQTLADNGGPTKTLEIEAGSVADGAGTPDTAVPADQRGVSRNDPPTIGAFEYIVLTVYNPTTSKTWMDRNLGASQIATSKTDAAAYGDLYQWGRFTEGHQIRTSTTHPNQATTPVPNAGNEWDSEFISGFSGEHENWLTTHDNDLWQGGADDNNPCPTGFRLPTQAEWDAERLTWVPKNDEGAYGSPLKLTVGGYRAYQNSALTDVGTLGFYWASTVASDDIQAHTLRIAGSEDGTHVTADHRAYGFSVRCIKH